MVTPGINQTGGMGTGSDHDLALFTNNSNKMIIKTDGKVGIGTVTPSADLHILNDDAMMWLEDATEEAVVAIVTPGAGQTGGVGTWTDHDLPLFTNNSDRMIIKSDGKVGVGTSIPSHQLHIAGNNSSLRLTGTSGHHSVAIRSLCPVC
jgi:hypothetical protein